MSLPLARPPNASMPLPSQKSLLAAMELAKYSSETATYLFDSAKKILTSANLQDQSKGLLDELDKFRQNVALQSVITNRIWSGGKVPDERVLFEFDNLQKQLAAQAATLVGTNNITFSYAISEETDFIRGYSSEGKPLDEKALAGMDTMFNAWLAENQMLSQGGVIYEYEADVKTKEIKPKKDVLDQPVRVSADKLKKMIVDPKDGFERFVQAKTQEDFKITSQEQPYPTEQKGVTV